MKNKINVYFSGNLIDESIVKFLKNSFEVNVIEISKEELYNDRSYEKLKSVDLMVFTGGEDIDPSIYGEEVGKFTQINKKRDKLEFNFLYNSNIPSSIIKKIPKLGICRGAQLLTVYNGGKLIQHVEGHRNNNQEIELTLIPETLYKKIQISSDHHQMMFPFNLNKTSYEIIGWSKNFQSNTYLNGKNEEIDLPFNFVETEIIYYPLKNSLCIQGHPEWCVGSEGADECIKLIKKHLFKEEIVNDYYVPQDEFSLPPHMSSFPLGWNVTSSTGEHYKFDGEKFIPREIYNSKIIKKFTIAEKKEKIIEDDVALEELTFEKTTTIKKEPYISTIYDDPWDETNNKIEF